MKKIYFLLSILFFTQCQNEKVSTSQNENAIVIITTKVKEGMMPDLVKFMDSENVLPVTRSFDGCKSVIQFVNEENNIHVLLEEWDTVESHQKYVNYRMNEDKTGAAEKHLTFAIGGQEGLSFLVNNTNYIYY
jgi:quinol monooxygenase YgiN